MRRFLGTRGGALLGKFCGQRPRCAAYEQFAQLYPFDGLGCG
jgi:hypothetical protein